MVNYAEVALLTVVFIYPCATILKLCIENPIFFALHPALNAIGFMVSFPIAIYAITEKTVTTDPIRRVQLVKIHFYALLFTLVCMSVAGVVAFVSKIRGGKDHFTSTHSKFAIGTSVFFTLNLIGGLLRSFSGKRVLWQWKDQLHRIGGIIATLTAGCTLAFGLETGNWGRTFLKEKSFILGMLTIGGYSMLGIRWLFATAITLQAPVKTSTEKENASKDKKKNETKKKK